MKSFNKLFFLPALLLIVACKSNKQSDPDETKTDSIPPIVNTIPETNTEEKKDPEIITPEKRNMMEGTVMIKGDAWIIRGTNALSEMKDYFPSNLSEEFRVEGIRVEFKGVLSEIPPNVRMVGAPITLTEIDRIK
jgi:hypothetical protein